MTIPPTPSDYLTGSNSFSWSVVPSVSESLGDYAPTGSSAGCLLGVEGSGLLEGSLVEGTGLLIGIAVNLRIGLPRSILIAHLLELILLELVIVLL